MGIVPDWTIAIGKVRRQRDGAGEIVKIEERIVQNNATNGRITLSENNLFFNNCYPFDKIILVWQHGAILAPLLFLPFMHHF